MNRFRLANRELFNHWFCQPDPSADYEFQFYDGFDYVANALFKMMVLQPCSVPTPKDYELDMDAHPHIQVCIPGGHIGNSARIMLNREINSGYWDFPISEFTNAATFLFVGFFDFGGMRSRDNQYVKIEVKDWPGHPETLGKRGLVESKYIEFVLHEIKKD